MAKPCLVAVHAHPDDEASKGAGTVAKYHSMGVRTVLVCATNGEEGDVLNPNYELPPGASMHEVRISELMRSAEVIGYDRVVLLGYRDSGMEGSEANARPEAFCNQDPDEVVSRLVEVFEKEQPGVVLSYGDDRKRYPHPDHFMVHETVKRAFRAYARKAREVKPRLFYFRFSPERLLAIHEYLLARNRQSPFDDKWVARARKTLARQRAKGSRSIVRVDVTAFLAIKREALLAHRSQIDPDSRWWFPVSLEEEAALFPYEEYELAYPKALVLKEGDDLFEGLG
jgi:mycothiol S-conjugate amidase